ncbi:MAG: sigma-70 family RNA polymerase sigma factor [Herpetosiphonaceae bacterium]|nr:sigma-70 family RNA polymerase sigma factor [Herpetosiphonaceae bacterium]
MIFGVISTALGRSYFDPEAAGSPVPQQAELSDETLARRLQGGDVDAFNVLVERYQQVILNVAYRIVGDRDEAQDIAQEVFVKVYQHIAQFKPERRFFSWIYRIAINTALQTRRKPQMTSLENLTLSVQTPLPDELAERAEQERELWTALATLSPREQALMGLRYGADLSYEEIAATMDVPLGTVKTWLFRAKQRLTTLLERGS